MLLLAVLPARAASEAEFRKLSKTYTLRADGSQEMRVQKELTLFTHAAMNGLYGETFIVYNPDFQKLEIHASYTRQCLRRSIACRSRQRTSLQPAERDGRGTHRT